MYEVKWDEAHTGYFSDAVVDVIHVLVNSSRFGANERDKIGGI